MSHVIACRINASLPVRTVVGGLECSARFSHPAQWRSRDIAHRAKRSFFAEFALFHFIARGAVKREFETERNAGEAGCEQEKEQRPEMEQASGSSSKCAEVATNSAEAAWESLFSWRALLHNNPSSLHNRYEACSPDVTGAGRNSPFWRAPDSGDRCNRDKCCGRSRRT
jgi:hypothetical protein